MLKSIYISFFIALTGASALNANNYKLEAKAAYFNPVSSDFQEIYSDAGIYGVELSFQTCDCTYIWASISDYWNSGTAAGGIDYNTKINYLPIGLGLKFIYPIGSIEPYLGGGALGARLKTKDESPFVIEYNSKWGIGGIVKAGFYLNFGCNCFLDLFADYSFLGIHFSNTNHGEVRRRTADMSGWSVGFGLGFQN